MLKRVSIQNFKSLKDVTLDLQKVNLLIGPNNSGKTNFLKALESFSMGGLGSNNIEILKSISYKHRPVDINYEFDYIPTAEGYMIRNNMNNGISLYHCVQKSIVQDKQWATNVDSIFDDWFENEHGDKINDTSPSHDRREFSEFISTKIFKPDPSKLLQQVKFSADQSDLLADCSNLISFYFYTDANFKRNSKSIQDDLSKCIPEIAYFTLPPVKVGNDSMLGLRFFDEEENGYWAEEVSEGVLYFLSLLCIIHQPNPPKLLLLEEPEKGIHPRRIYEVIQFILGLADDKDIQVIMTTHSPIVLDMFKDMTESVFIFDKDDEGATRVKNLQRDVIEPDEEESKRLGIEPPHYTNSLGSSWTVGFLGGVPK
ncbi:AAA family ATPase [Spirosoma pollinicola]|uniref:Chromosome segregation protein SMC n=1 Tax=Spirosoma pollinicola TaxID=2057025 RepID=A0A2K8YZY4_9BACT|nr:ATP-binding protein [Spirosoma pollinicola]AUD03197.1 chromosome segregation protein SMC [Spirosoma pollinicola]